jgi:hypothetical protein
MADALDLADLPPSYRLITSRAEDISQMTLVAHTPAPNFELVSRIHGWRPIPAARIISAAEKRKARDCPLCNADAKAHSIVWHAYGTKKSVDGAVVAAQDSGIDGVTPALIKRHFPNHNYDQPQPLKRLAVEDQLHLADTLSDRSRRILLTIYRQRALSTRQIIQLFFESTTSNDKSAAKSAYRLLHELRFEHLLYPFRTERRKSPEVYYALGRHAVPYVERQEGRLTGDTTAVTKREQVKEYQLEHDIMAADVFVQMRRQLYTSRGQDNLVEVDGQPMSLHLPTECWWGERSLRMGFTDAVSGAEMTVIPDGFAGLRMNDGRHHQYMLPFFIEWDSGHKTLEDTTEQMVNHVALARSGAVGKRFPQLALPDYAPPILMVTSTPNRALRISMAVKQALEAKGLTQADVPMMLITDLETMRQSAYAPGAWREIMADGIPGQPQNLVELLLRANAGLIERAPIHWRVPIVMDSDGARPTSSKSPAFAKGRDRRGEALPRFNALKDPLATMATGTAFEAQVGDLIDEGDQDTTGLDRLAEIVVELEGIELALAGD